MNNKILYEEIINGKLVIVKRTVNNIFTGDKIETVVLARKLVGNTVKIDSIAEVVKQEDTFGFKISGVYSQNTLAKLAMSLQDLNENPKIIIDTTKQNP